MGCKFDEVIGHSPFGWGSGSIADINSGVL